MELNPKPAIDPLLQRMLNGDWAEVGGMSEEVRRDTETAREVERRLGELK